MQNKPCDYNEISLAAYLEGTLPDAERLALERHLRTHPECSEVLETLQKVLHQLQEGPLDAVPETLLRRALQLRDEQRSILDLVIAIVQDTLTVVSHALDVQVQVLEPAANLRTGKTRGASLVVMKKIFGNVAATVSVERSPQGLFLIPIAVSEGDPAVPAQDLRVELISRGRELGSSMVENGTVLFEEVNAGQYDIVLRRKGALLGSMSIMIQQ